LILRKNQNARAVGGPILCRPLVYAFAASGPLFGSALRDRSSELPPSANRLANQKHCQDRNRQRAADDKEAVGIGHNEGFTTDRIRQLRQGLRMGGTGAFLGLGGEIAGDRTQLIGDRDAVLRQPVADDRKMIMLTIGR